MKNIIKYWQQAALEMLFQVVLHLIVFVFYAFDWNSPGVEPFEVAFFFNYALVAFLINYLLLPRYLYAKAYLKFAFFVILLMAAALLIEEFVLEQIYFPYTRAQKFPGVFYTMLDILPVTVILIGFKFAWDALRKERELKDLQATIKESELQFLKSQINPHFLFNNMNNLYAHTIEQSPKTPEIILGLSAVLRYMLYDCKAEYVLLSKEIEHLQNFINISELQIEDRGSVCFAADLKGDYHIAPLILVVFVENAFKHSTASQSSNIFIEVKVVVKEEGELMFSCINSFEEQSNTEHLSNGIGLENVQKRLDLLYPDSYELTFKEEDNLFKVFLLLKLNQVA
ncbi:sensor histidine kinase [Aureispira anguillae]|uniref:Histidine kinase n=1 Tax=Aureispira anguillae TaxID=2864201 RepID=A0A916DPR7_9BACT|nr:histidine kinase [Aureispira anguillae]BDS10719.1 histidine kinase [Aureispira anguillae]